MSAYRTLPPWAQIGAAILGIGLLGFVANQLADSVARRLRL